MVLHPAALFYFTQKLILILNHLFDKYTLIDDGLLSGKVCVYFCYLRSGELAWRKGNNFHVEAYNPHRFARQFSNFQGLVSLPTCIKIVGKVASLERIQKTYLYFMRLGTGNWAIILNEMVEQDNF